MVSKSILLMFIVLIVTSCSTTQQTRKVAEASGFLVDYSMLRNGKYGEAHKVFVKTGVNWKKYDKIMIDTIEVWASEDADIKTANKEDVIKILSYLHVTIRNAIKNDFEIVHKGGPGVLRLKVALTDGQASSPARDLLSNLVPIGLALSYLKNIAGGTHLSVGVASIEAELVDSVSGERLMAVMDSRSGAKVLRGKFDSWDDVKGAFGHWSARLQSRLKDLRLGK